MSCHDFGRGRNPDQSNPANGVSFRRVRHYTVLGDAQKSWSCSSEALAGNFPNNNLWGMTSNTLNFMVYVSPQFAQSATDAPKAGLFESWQVHRH
jgi:hypothetical protein